MCKQGASAPCFISRRENTPMPRKTIAEFKEERIALNEVLLRSKNQ